MNLKPWIHAARLRTLPLSLAGILFGSMTAYYKGFWSLNIFSLALLTTLLLQILSNFANDLGDSQKGTDNDDRVGPIRAVQSGDISQSQMKKAVIVLSFVTFISAFCLIYASYELMDMNLIIGYGIAALACVFAAIFYTVGKKAYGYRGLGDVFVFLFFGIVSIIGSYGLFSKTIELEMILPAISFGCLSVAVLNLNNMRDIENDRNCGKITIPARIGNNAAKNYHYALILIAFFSLLIFLSKTEGLLYLSILPFGLLLKHCLKVSQIETPKDFDPELKKVALSTFAVSLIFTLLVLILK